DSAFEAFRCRQRKLAADDSCSCNACRSVSSLNLKIVAHHGRFLRQIVGGHAQLAGADVILAHRLLKNQVARRRAYVLLTEAALQWIVADRTAVGWDVHRERYDHLGEIVCHVRNLEPSERAGDAGKLVASLSRVA